MPPLALDALAAFILLNAVIGMVTYVTLLERKFAARMALSRAYLLCDPHPPMKSPTISSDDTARKNSTPMLRSASPRSGANGIVAKISMHGTRKAIGARL